MLYFANQGGAKAKWRRQRLYKKRWFDGRTLDVTWEVTWEDGELNFDPLNLFAHALKVGKNVPPRVNCEVIAEFKMITPRTYRNLSTN